MPAGGRAVGPRGNTLYFRITRGGERQFVPDTWTTSPHLAGQPPIAGIPMCNAITAPRPAAGPRIADTVNWRDCTNINLAGCAARGQIPWGTPVTMHCWIDDSPVTGLYRSARWFYVTATNGVRAFVHSSFVADQATVPHCSTHRGISASRWAAMRVGATSPTQAEAAGTGAREWSGWCYLFAQQAHAQSHGTRPYAGLGTARATFDAYSRNGRVSTNMNPDAIPIGSIVFWRSVTSAGHAAVYVGQGHVISTQGIEGQRRPVARLPLTHWGTPSGWVAPGSI